jgi:hypothetical protein
MTNLSALTREELEAMVLRSQQAAQRKLTLKVSEKGAVSLYGMGRFPVTLYGSQWERLLDSSIAIQEFLKDNAGLLSVKA